MKSKLLSLLILSLFSMTPRCGATPCPQIEQLIYSKWPSLAGTAHRCVAPDRQLISDNEVVYFTPVAPSPGAIVVTVLNGSACFLSFDDYASMPGNSQSTFEGLYNTFVALSVSTFNNSIRKPSVVDNNFIINSIKIMNAGRIIPDASTLESLTVFKRTDSRLSWISESTPTNEENGDKPMRIAVILNPSTIAVWRVLFHKEGTIYRWSIELVNSI